VRGAAPLAAGVAAAAVAAGIVAVQAADPEVARPARARDLVVVPAGWFEMGDDLGAPDERPARRLWLSRYAIDRFEVSNGGGPGPGPVGSYPGGASPYGALDVAGNVAEWVADPSSWGGYGDWPAADPVGSGPPWNHSIRGSAWFGSGGTDPAVASRCAERNSSHSYDDPPVGFRCALSVPPEPRQVPPSS
jgi:formylglycine-generating enzyme required for sulfatase activity